MFISRRTVQQTLLDIISSKPRLKLFESGKCTERPYNKHSHKTEKRYENGDQHIYNDIIIDS